MRQITKDSNILGLFTDVEYSTIVYQILYDAKLNNELVSEIIILPNEIKFRTIRLTE